MNLALKQRLVGATVLVALGVIFVPMLLERGADDSRLSIVMEIPPQPKPPAKNPLDNPPDVKPIQALKPVEKSINEAKKASKQKAKVNKKPVADSNNRTTGSDSTPKPAKQTSASTGSGKWLVQVGSFGQQANAEVLRDKLKSSGFAAYMETAQANTGSIYRVRIGPFDDRSKAEKLVVKLSKQGAYQAIVLTND